MITLKEAKNLIKNVERMTEENFVKKEDTTRMAVLFCLSYLYKNRNTADFHTLMFNPRSVLFAQREGII